MLDLSSLFLSKKDQDEFGKLRQREESAIEQHRIITKRMNGKNGTIKSDKGGQDDDSGIPE